MITLVNGECIDIQQMLQLYLLRTIPIRGNETLALTLNTYGNKQWILHSGVDYDDPTQTTSAYFESTKRRQQDKVHTKQFEKAVLYDDRTNKVDLTLVPKIQVQKVYYPPGR